MLLTKWKNFYFLSILAFFGISSCSTIKRYYFKNGEKYINVNSIGISGDGKKDNRIALESAFNKGGNYYFPKGEYLINSYTYVYNIVRIAENTIGLKLFFEEGAIIKAADNLIPKGSKGCLLCFISEKGDIPFIEIQNLQVDGNKAKQKGTINGILFYEQPKFSLKKVLIDKAYIHHVSGGGIHTEALYSKLNNIRTEQCGSHGIGINQTFHAGIEHFTEIDGFFSLDDDAYSIDFSAPSDENDEKKANPNFQFKGIAKNITSINALYGIKTAGYWNLNMENVKIINSRNNGFFLSKNAQNKTVTIKNLYVSKCKGNGLYLDGTSNFIGENIKLDSCFAPLTIRATTTKIHNLCINNDYKNIACIQIGSENNQIIEIDSFSIRGNNEENIYMINNSNDNVKLSNGYIESNKSPYFMLLNEQVKKCEITDMHFNENKFYNLITPLGGKKTLKINRIKGFNKQNLMRQIENRQQDKLIID